MKLKNLLYVFAILVLLNFAVPAQDTDFKFYQIGKIKKCENCEPHTLIDSWSVKFRVENYSDKDLFLYGSRFEPVDKKSEKQNFEPYTSFQRRNPDICEWQYGNGSPKKEDWNKVSSFYKERHILKSKQFVDLDLAITVFDLNNTLRFAVYVSENRNEDSHEIFSDSFRLTQNEIGEEVKYVIADSFCNPTCTLSLQESPSIRGLKLGMSVEEFRKLFPASEISDADKFNVKEAWIPSGQEYSSASINFLNNKIVRIWTALDLPIKTSEESVSNIVKKRFGLSKVWTRRNDFECQDFKIEVVPSKSPTIIITDKKAEEILDKRVMDSYTKKTNQ